MKALPKQFSDAWLKEFRIACANPNFVTTPPKTPIGIKSDYQKEYWLDKNGKKHDGKNLTDKEWSNLQIARALIESR